MDNQNKEELVKLIEYLIHHNEHHNEELIELAASIKDINKDAYLKVLKAIEEYKKGNNALSDALDELNK